MTTSNDREEELRARYTRVWSSTKTVEEGLKSRLDGLLSGAAKALENGDYEEADRLLSDAEAALASATASAIGIGVAIGIGTIVVGIVAGAAAIGAIIGVDIV